MEEVPERTWKWYLIATIFGVLALGVGNLMIKALITDKKTSRTYKSHVGKGPAAKELCELEYGDNYDMECIVKMKKKVVE
jgi:hypothetical protein